MLVTEEEVRAILNEYKINIDGVLYQNLGIKKYNMVWIDGNKDKVIESQKRGIPNVYYGVISNEDDKEVEFKITNNGQSSSILDFGTHSAHYPHIHFVEVQKHQTITIDSFYERNNLDMTKYNFWNFDIQGAELLALKGAMKSIEYVKALYLEVNIEEVYKGAALMSDLDDFLSKYNFKRVVTKMTGYGWGDALYIKAT
jgi:FkbM family methyltransferase